MSHLLAALLLALAQPAHAQDAAETLRELTELVAAAPEDPSSREFLAARLATAIEQQQLTPEDERELVEITMEISGDRLVKHLARVVTVPPSIQAAPGAFLASQRSASRQATRQADRAFRRARANGGATATRCVVRRMLQLQQLEQMAPSLRTVYRQSKPHSTARTLVLSRLYVLDQLTAERVEDLRQCQAGLHPSRPPISACESDLDAPRYDEFSGDFVPSPSCVPTGAR